MPAGERARLIRENERFRRQNETLERSAAQHDGTIALLHKQINDLQAFGPDRPATAFAPVKIEIASLTGGADYDGKPGDDGVTVHLRLLDIDGDAVKVPGRITVQLVDSSQMGQPRVLGLYRFDELAQLRKAWHGRFGTQHYTLRCPFSPGLTVPTSRRLDVKAEFVDYLSGATLTAVKEVSLSYPNDE